MQLGNEYHYYDPSTTKWYLVDEFGDVMYDEVTYGPCGASAILANGHAKLVDAKDVKFKAKDFWPKAWLWTQDSFFFQLNDFRPLAYYRIVQDDYMKFSRYEYIKALDDEQGPFNYVSRSYKVGHQKLVSEKSMPEFLADVQAGKELSNWIKDGKVLKQ